jgi:hypothetical protein
MIGGRARRRHVLAGEAIEPGHSFLQPHLYMVDADHGTQSLGIQPRRERRRATRSDNMAAGAQPRLAKLTRSPLIARMPLRQLRRRHVRESPATYSADDDGTHRAPLAADRSDHERWTIRYRYRRRLEGIGTRPSFLSQSAACCNRGQLQLFVVLGSTAGSPIRFLVSLYDLVFLKYLHRDTNG